MSAITHALTAPRLRRGVVLPIFFVVVKATRRVPWWIVWLAGAALEMAPIATGWVVIDEFASRFVYFYSGYAFAPLIFRLADAALDRPALAVGYLGVWSVVNGVAVFTSGDAQGAVDLVPFGLGVFELKVAAIDADGDRADDALETVATRPFEVTNAAPVAAAGADRAVPEGTLVTLDAAASFDPDGAPLTFIWDFGDGASGTGAARRRSREPSSSSA